MLLPWFVSFISSMILMNVQIISQKNKSSGFILMPGSLRSCLDEKQAHVTPTHLNHWLNYLLKFCRRLLITRLFKSGVLEQVKPAGLFSPAIDPQNRIPVSVLCEGEMLPFSNKMSHWQKRWTIIVCQCLGTKTFCKPLNKF